MSTPLSDFDSPFGTYALPRWREAIRRVGGIWPKNKLGLVLASATRRLSLMGHERGLDGPHDVDVSANIHARVFPKSNRCEKRAYCGVQTWDAPERQFLSANLGNGSTPFVFLDVGANVGLYSLFLHDHAKRTGRKLHAIAIEPDPENRARLAFNAKSSAADLTIEAVAVSGESGSGFLSASSGNRGGIGLQEKASIGGVEVPLEPLTNILARNGVTAIDAMKVDIEGHDLVALKAFFRDAEPALYPKRLLLEIDGGSTDSPLIGLALTNGYTLAGRTRVNAMLERKEQ